MGVYCIIKVFGENEEKQELIGRLKRWIDSSITLKAMAMSYKLCPEEEIPETIGTFVVSYVTFSTASLDKEKGYGNLIMGA